MIPQAVERIVPDSVEELCALLARCDAAGTKIVVAGGETLRGMGSPPSGHELVLQTTALRRIVSYRPADLTIAVQSGATLKSLATRMKREGQFVPFDAPKPAHATIGGTLAAGWAGPRRHRYGRPRDLLVGSTIALADGTLAHAGGIVAKNVAGYDMSRLYVGSFGTLGVLLQANFKTLPLPPVARAFIAPLPEATRSRAIAHVRALAVEPSVAAWIEGFTGLQGDDGLEGRLFLLFEGTQALIERATRDLRSALGRAGVPETSIVDERARDLFDRFVDASISTVADRSMTYRIAATPDRVEACAIEARDHVRRFALDADVIADVMNGDVIVRASRRDTRDLALKFQVLDDALHAVEPRARVIAGDHPMRPALRVWGDEPNAIERMRALKARFDPRATLNPGRFVGGI
ncbi:MAG TPA: FAD-binding oxidoreductase [Candidatus Tyrphobacter sp.]